MAGGDYNQHSDGDLLVDALAETSALNLCGLEIDAEKLLSNPVNVVMVGGLHETTQEGVFGDAVLL